MREEVVDKNLAELMGWMGDWAVEPNRREGKKWNWMTKREMGPVGSMDSMRLEGAIGEGG